MKHYKKSFRPRYTRKAL